jgi:hypothetical protein
MSTLVHLSFDLRREKSKALLCCHALFAKLVVRAKASRMCTLAGLAYGSILFQSIRPLSRDGINEIHKMHVDVVIGSSNAGG